MRQILFFSVVPVIFKVMFHLSVFVLHVSQRIFLFVMYPHSLLQFISCLVYCYYIDCQTLLCTLKKFVKSSAGVLSMLSKLTSDITILCADDRYVCSTEFVCLMSAVANVAVGVSGVLLYPMRYYADE